MASKINHVAIMSGNYALEAKFYEAVFGMKSSPKARPTPWPTCRWTPTS